MGTLSPSGLDGGTPHGSDWMGVTPPTVRTGWGNPPPHQLLGLDGGIPLLGQDGGTPPFCQEWISPIGPGWGNPPSSGMDGGGGGYTSCVHAGGLSCCNKF